MKKITLAAASALTFALAVPLIAQAGGHKGGGHRLEMLDTNSDGTIARAEAEAAAAASFGKIDTNGDRYLTQEELKAGHEAHRAEMKAKWAENREGKEPRAPKGDADPAEMEARKAKMETKASERFAAVDTNTDGRWSTAEYTAHRLEHFTRLDTDSDGNISAAEQDAAKARMKERRANWRDKPAGQ